MSTCSNLLIRCAAPRRRHHAQSLRREAIAIIEGEVDFDDPWNHLIQARGYRLIGEQEKAKQELATASATAAKDDDLWRSNINADRPHC